MGLSHGSAARFPKAQQAFVAAAVDMYVFLLARQRFGTTAAK